jgi:hypothetical protein
VDKIGQQKFAVSERLTGRRRLEALPGEQNFGGEHSGSFRTNLIASDCYLEPELERPVRPQVVAGPATMNDERVSGRSSR